VTNHKNRLDKLEFQFGKKKPVRIYYREGHQTCEQAVNQYKEKNGVDLPNHATVTCYQRIDAAKLKIQ
tara:strand:+ start:1530 stop:1733 length:204 start_codon:yes stop_codon:yes gene_type:complete